KVVPVSSPTWAFWLTRAHVARRIPAMVSRTSGQRRRSSSVSTWAGPPDDGASAPAGAAGLTGGAGADDGAGAADGAAFAGATTGVVPGSTSGEATAVEGAEPATGRSADAAGLTGAAGLAGTAGLAGAAAGCSGSAGATGGRRRTASSSGATGWGATGWLATGWAAAGAAPGAAAAAPVGAAPSPPRSRRSRRAAR